MQSFFWSLKNAVCARSCLAVWVLLSAIAAITGPFGTYLETSLFSRSLYWASLIGTALVFSEGVKIGVKHLWPDLSFPMSAVAATTLFVLLFTPTTIVACALNPSPFGTDLPIGTIVLTAAALCMGTQKLDYLNSTKLVSYSSEPRLVQRLPMDIRGPLIRITVRDHYVDVYTDKGMHSLLMRFRDAADEVEGVEGFCIHRSHWVARRAIADVVMEKGRPFVIMNDGEKVPVSRKYRYNVEAAGLL